MEMLHILVAVSFFSYLYHCLLYRSTVKIQQDSGLSGLENVPKAFLPCRMTSVHSLC